jgi:hypothetical protein
MSDKKDERKKKKSPQAKKNIKGEISSPKEHVSGKAEMPQSASAIGEKKGFLGDAAKNVGESAKMEGEKATDFTDRIVDKLKKGLSQTYDAGTKVVDELSQTAQRYAEKYIAESEIKKLQGRRDMHLMQLGHAILKRHLATGKVTRSYFKEKEIIEQFNQIEMLDKQIIHTGKRLDKAKK